MFEALRRKPLAYIAIAAVFATSLVLPRWLPPGEFFERLAAIPLIASLVAALFQVVRDQAAHDRSVALLELQHGFSLGASSHMANIAFDKHVQFCEEYVEEVQKTFTTLFREGPTSEVLRHTSTLYTLQQKYAVWLTDRMNSDLEKFESTLRRLGATAHYVDVAPRAEDRHHRIAEMYKSFANLMGAKFMGANEWEGESLTEELAIAMVIRRLRVILGTEELSEMRAALVSKSLESLRDGGKPFD